MVPSLFQDHTVSCVRIVSGVDKNVTESMLTTKEEDIASGKPIAKARPRQKPTVTLTSVSIPVSERKWIDIATQRSHDQKCFDKSKAITRLLRHDQSVPRGSDGAIHYSDVIDECRKKKIDDASQWSLENWISALAKRRRRKEKISILRESKLFQSVPVRSSNSRTFRRQCCWSCIGRQWTVTERIYRVHLPRREREWIEFNNKKWIISRKEQASREEDKRSSSLQWIRWKTYVQWGKLHAIKDRAIQEYLETPSTYHILVLFEVRSTCNFTKHGHMQSSTHCLQLALRKRYVWKLRRSSTRRCAWLRECHESC